MILITGDFETYYDREFSLSKITTQEYILDPLFEVICISIKVADREIQHFTGTMLETKAWLQQFPWKNAMFIAHNVLFDGAILAYKFDIRPKMYFCTMMGARPFLAPFIDRGRTSLAKTAQYLGLPAKGGYITQAMGKRRLDFTPYEMAQYMEYCDLDTNLCFSIAKYLLPLFPKKEILALDLTIKKYTNPVLQLDADIIETALAAHKLEKAAVLDRAGLRDRTLLMSNDKFAAALKLLGVSPPLKVSPATGKTTYAFAKTDPGMKALLSHDDPSVQCLVTARLAHKSTIQETRLQRFLNVSRTGGALGVPLLYYGAHTGRLSGWDKMNMQNLTNGSALRDAIVAGTGYKIIAGDLSSIEARIVACLAGCLGLINAFAAGEDVYCKFASILFGREITEDDFVERFLGKTTILGCGYGVGYEKLHATVTLNPNVDITLQEAHRIVNLYRTTYAEIPELWKEATLWLAHMAGGYKEDYVISFGPLKIHTYYSPMDTPEAMARAKLQGLKTPAAPAIVLPNGMPIYYPELEYGADRQYTYKSRTGVKKLWGGAVIENVCQAMARIVITEAELFLAMRGHTAANQVHDELIYHIPEASAAKFAMVLNKVMSRDVPWMPNLPVAAKVKIGDNYGECK